MQTVPPTAGPLAACPHCGARIAKPTGPVRFEYGVGVVGNQQCNGCGANWRYHYDAGTSRRSRRFLFPAFVVVVVVAVVVGAVALASSREPRYPSRWNARVRPIAMRVEALRGLSFEHPVKVNFLTAVEFASRITTDADALGDHRREIERRAALLRAMGLLGADVDLARAERTAATTRTGAAFYDEDTDQVYVRGTGPLTAEQRVSLARELARALQDQHFHLNDLDKRAQTSDAGSYDAFRTVVEGDAARVQGLFLAGLDRADQDDYALRTLVAKQAGDAYAADVPAVVRASFGAADNFGDPTTQALAGSGGNASVDAAIDGPPPSTRVYFDPGSVKRTPKIPAVPDLLDGEKELPALAEGDDHFENFDFYLMLAAKLDVQTALRAADAFESAAQVAYTDDDGRTCFRAAIDGVTRASSTYLAEILSRWAATMPRAGVSFTATGVLLHSCDPGDRAVTPADARIQRAVRLAAGRDELVASLVRRPLPLGLAVCAARLLVQQPDFADAIFSGSTLDQPTPQMVQESKDAGRACRADPKSGVG